MRLYGDIVDDYRDFIDHADDSPCFQAWATGVIEDPEVQAWIASLPLVKQQANLVFAAARWHGVPAPGPYAGLREALLRDDGQIRGTILQRATQTNEVGRLATLMPVFAQVAAESPRPIALLEVGTSAGLTLFPERYDYLWPPSGELHGSGGPVLSARVAGEGSLPATYPEISWRAGLDVHPLHVDDEDAMRWLETLVWPEDDRRRAQLRAAIEIAQTDPPRIVETDAVAGLPALVDEAAAYGTVLVFHSAVVPYFPPALRADFADLMHGLVSTGAVRWISNEAPSVVPGITTPEPHRRGSFLTALDGVPIAWAQGHGRTMTWL